VEKSPRLPGDLEDSEDEFEPPSTLSTAPTMPVIPPTHSSHQDPSREDGDRQPRPTLIPSLPPVILDKGREDRRLVINQPEEVIETQRYAHRLGSGGTKRMWRWNLTHPLKISILDGAGTCHLSWSRLSQRRMEPMTSKAYDPESDEPSSIGSPKRRDRKKISFNENPASIAFLQEASFDPHTPC
jgi:hypothetical protein